MRQILKLSLMSGSVVCILAFCLFKLLPRQIIGCFGDGSDLYFTVAQRYFRIYMFFTFLNNIQPLSSTFFTSIGMPGKGAFLSLTRQILFLLPLIVVLPLFLGIDGIMYAGPVADLLAALIAALMLRRQMGKMKENIAGKKDFDGKD